MMTKSRKPIDLHHDKDHKRMILEVYPKATDKVFTLKEYAGYDKEDWDIADPFGHDIETYKACAAEINEVLSKFWTGFSILPSPVSYCCKAGTPARTGIIPP